MTATLTSYETDLKVTVDATQIIDDVIAAAPLADIVITEQFAGNTIPTTVLWLLSFTVDRSAPPALAPKLTVNGKPTLIEIGSPGGPCPMYGIIALSPSVDALITGTAPPPGNGDVLRLTYAYTSSPYVRLQDPAPITAYQGIPNRGLFTNAAGAGSSLLLSQALAEAKSTLNGYSTPTTVVDATVGEYYEGEGLRKFQEVEFTSNRLGLLGLQMLITALHRNGSVGNAQQRIQITAEQ